MYKLEKKKVLFIFAIIICGLIAFSNIVAVRNNCLSTYDLGLYFQALVNMANGELNPYLSVRSLNIFNDHFEPILFVAVPSVWLSGGSPIGPIIFEWLTFVVFIYSLIKINNFKNILPIFFLCLFSRGIVTALVFPIHPNTWSMLAWLMLVYFLNKDNFIGMIMTSFSLLLFRESNVFVLPGISFFYLINKSWNKFIITLGTSVIGLLLVFKFRIMIFGEVYNYGGAFIHSLINEHFIYIWRRITELDLKSFLKVFGPISIPLVFIIKTEKEKLVTSKFFFLFCALAPVFFLHVLAGKIHYHYGITFIAPLLSYIIISSKFDIFVKNRKILYLTMGLFILTSSSTYTKWFKLSLLSKSKSCIISSEKREAMSEFRKLFDQTVEINKTVFSSGRLVPAIMSAKRKIYVPSHFSIHLTQYDYLIMEKNFGGEFRSLTKERYMKIKDFCNTDEEKIILDDKYFFFLRGPIDNRCYNYFSFM